MPADVADRGQRCGADQWVGVVEKQSDCRSAGSQRAQPSGDRDPHLSVGVGMCAGDSVHIVDGDQRADGFDAHPMIGVGDVVPICLDIARAARTQHIDRGAANTGVR